MSLKPGGRTLDFKSINAAALPHLEAILDGLSPKRARSGDHWLILDPTREDHNLGSFKVGPDGRWFENASGAKGGDLISLLAHCSGVDQATAARELQDRYGPFQASSDSKRTLGPHLAEWTYRDAQGHPVMRVRRYEGKEFRPFISRDGRWIAGFPKPRPLFNLDALFERPDAPVLVVEGEKSAVTAARLFPAFVVTTSSGGSKSSKETDWSPLQGRDVVLWPDHDAPGLGYAGDVHALLKVLETPLRVVEVPKAWPDKWDLADRPPAGILPDDLARMISEAQPWTGAPEPSTEADDQEVPLIDLVLSGPDLARLQVPTREMIVDPFIPTGSLNMVAAARGVGKTFFGMELCRSVTQGQGFFDWNVPAAREVLFLDGEMPTAVIQERFNLIFGGADRVSDRLVVLPSESVWTQAKPLNLNAPESQNRIQALLDALRARGRNIQLIIIDNLSSMSIGGKESDNDLQDSILQWLMGLRHQGYAVLLVHHTGKNGEQRGASRREDLLDTSILLKKPENGAYAEGAAFSVEFTKERGRKARPNTLSVALETGDHGEPVWTRIKAFPEFLRALALIRDQHPASVTDLGKLMDITRQGAQKHVTKLREKGFLRPMDLGLTTKGTKCLEMFLPQEAA